MQIQQVLYLEGWIFARKSRKMEMWGKKPTRVTGQLTPLSTSVIRIILRGIEASTNFMSYCFLHDLNLRGVKTLR